LTNERVLCHWIILLNGTSCSGKTTLSGALQRRLSLPRRPFLHIEADRFLPHLPDDVGDGSLAVPMHRALHRAIASFAGQGFDLIVDGVLPYGHPDSIADALSIFRRHRLCYIGVHCDLDVLEQRERERVDRNEGWARRQFQDLHDGAVYDIEVDTTMTGADENADRTARYLFHRDAGLVATKQQSTR
jgi:chloramphenicol 3-O phosphotransferase